MYVDIMACKPGRVKVGVNLVKSGVRKSAPVIRTLPVIRNIPAVVAEPVVKTEPVVVPLAVRLSEKAAEMNVQTLELADEEPIIPVEEEVKTSEELEQMAAETISSIDEMLAASEVDEAEGELDDIVSGALDELDSMSRRTDDMMDSISDQFAEALDEINDSSDENSEQFNTTMQECIDSVENAISQRETESAEAESETETEPEAEADIDPFDEPEVKAEPEAEADIDPFDEPEVKAEPETEADIDPFAEPDDKGSLYMRYFSRDEQGEKFEVDDKKADGQEVVCYNESNGKLSRVCGIIKKEDNKAEYAVNITAEESDADEIGEDKENGKKSKKKGKKKRH